MYFLYDYTLQGYAKCSNLGTKCSLKCHMTFLDYSQTFNPPTLCHFGYFGDFQNNFLNWKQTSQKSLENIFLEKAEPCPEQHSLEEEQSNSPKHFFPESLAYFYYTAFFLFSSTKLCFNSDLTGHY